MDKEEIQKMVKDAYTEEITNRTKEAIEILRSLRDTAQQLGPETVAEVERDLARYVPVKEIQRTLLDRMGISDKGGSDGTATRLRMSDISDEDFYRSLADPAECDLSGTPHGPTTPNAGAPSFRDVSNDDFFRSLSDPAARSFKQGE